MDVPEDDEGKPPASFIGEGIPPAPRSEPHRASGSAAAVEPVVPKGELLYSTVKQVDFGNGALLCAHSSCAMLW